MIQKILHISFLACVFACFCANAGTDILVPFEVLASGTNSGAQQDKPTLHQIKDQSSWEAFWDKHVTITPKSQPLTVDFSRKQVLAIVDSDQPNSGYSLRVDRIEQHNAQIWVYVTREQPAPECINLGMVAQPYVFVTVNHSSSIAKMIFNTRMKGCPT